MQTNEAFNILGLSQETTMEAVKQAYKDMARKYHPDINPDGLETMQKITLAYSFLVEKDFPGTEKPEFKEELSTELKEVLQAVEALEGLEIEVCGTWIWIGGNSRAHKDTLKEAGFRWAPKKMKWYFHEGPAKKYYRGKTDMEDIRRNHGSSKVKGSRRQKLN